MATVFTRIIDGEIPGRFIWSDETCAAFLSANPLTPGHTLVVPREEVDQWTQASPELMAHLAQVARLIGVAQQAEWDAERVGLLVQGYEVPHLHLHVWATTTPAEFDLSRAQTSPDPAMMDEAAARLRSRLRSQLEGTDHAAHVPAETTTDA